MIEVSVSGNSAYNSIQAAVDAAIGNNPAPDLILIRDGVYDEKVTINSRNLRITGESFQRVLLKSALQIKGSGIELENLQNGENVIGRNDRRDMHALFLCGCLEAIPSGPPPFQHYIYNETISGGTVKGTVVLGHLGRVELFLRPGDLLALLCGRSESDAHPYFCPGNGREFPLYLEMFYNAALENGAEMLLIYNSSLPEPYRTALKAFAKEKGILPAEDTWPILPCKI